VSKHRRLTNLDASLPLEVDASQFGVVVDGGDVRLDRLADEPAGVQQFLAVSLEVSDARAELPVSSLALRVRTGPARHRVRRRTARACRRRCNNSDCLTALPFMALNRGTVSR